MKIERDDDCYWVSVDGGERIFVPGGPARALIRLGMEHQRERSAVNVLSQGQFWRDEGGEKAAETIRAQPILATDIEAAIGEGE